MKPHVQHQRGAALLAAMLTVTLVATLSAAALWQQWRNVEVETAERGRAQASWVLSGAVDWARLILREDGRSGGADHLGEPWALALQEARLSTFLNEANTDDSAQSAFLAGQIIDLQSKLNINNLIDDNKLSPPAVQAFTRLFQLLGLPLTELQLLQDQLLRASQGRSATGNAPIALRPQRVEELVWLGLSPQTVWQLQPYVTFLPERTPLNINTASAEALYAVIPGLDLASAQRLVSVRETGHYASVPDAAKVSPRVNDASTQLSIATRFFEVRGQLRIDHNVVQALSVLQRDGLTVRTLWQRRGSAPELVPGSANTTTGSLN